mgnify:CR=1 FL=1
MRIILFVAIFYSLQILPTESSNKFEDPEFVNKFRSSIFRDMLAGGSAADKYFREETDVKFYFLLKLNVDLKGLNGVLYRF